MADPDESKGRYVIRLSLQNVDLAAQVQKRALRWYDALAAIDAMKGPMDPVKIRAIVRDALQDRD